jgi:hypothetical protein
VKSYIHGMWRACHTSFNEKLHCASAKQPQLRLHDCNSHLLYHCCNIVSAILIQLMLCCLFLQLSCLLMMMMSLVV